MSTSATLPATQESETGVSEKANLAPVLKRVSATSFDSGAGSAPTTTRQLATAPPTADGTVWLDFNRTTNLPCAYTDFTTCPVPLPPNRLPVAVEAGEKLPRERTPPKHG